MSRVIRECSSDEFVWEYSPGEQVSEQARLHREFGLGSYRANNRRDLLTLDAERDVPLLHELAEQYRSSVVGFRRGGASVQESRRRSSGTLNPDIRFREMVIAMSDFANSHPELKTFRFESESRPRGQVDSKG